MERRSPWALVGLCAVMLFWVAFWLDVHWLQLATKPLPVLCMALALGAAPGDSFTGRLRLGLIICAIADLAIEFSFLAGLGIFLIAHLFYLGAFLSEEARLHFGKSLFFAAFGICAYWILRPGLGEMSTAVALYTAVICSMMWRAMSLLSSRRPWATLIFLGAVLFAISDTIIAFNRFYTPIVGARYWILGLYWLGQLFLTRGALRRS